MDYLIAEIERQNEIIKQARFVMRNSSCHTAVVDAMNAETRAQQALDQLAHAEGA